MGQTIESTRHDLVSTSWWPWLTAERVLKLPFLGRLNIENQVMGACMANFVCMVCGGGGQSVC